MAYWLFLCFGGIFAQNKFPLYFPRVGCVITIMTAGTVQTKARNVTTSTEHARVKSLHVRTLSVFGRRIIVMGRTIVVIEVMSSTAVSIYT